MHLHLVGPGCYLEPRVLPAARVAEAGKGSAENLLVNEIWSHSSIDRHD